MRTELKFALLSTLYFFSLCLGSCTEEKEIKIGVSQCSTDDWRMNLNQELLREAMLHPEVTVEILSADDDSQKQIRDLEYFESNGFDVILVSPNEAEAVTPKIKELHNKGQKLIMFDRNTTEPCYDVYIGADNIGIGNLAADYVARKKDRQARILEIQGLPGSTPARHRREGFESRISKYDNAEIVDCLVGNWNYEDAFRVTDSLLSLRQDFNVIYAHNDRMAMGASEALNKHGVERTSVEIIGVDASPNIGLKSVVDGVIDATFIYPTEGHLLLSTALDLHHGNPLPSDTIVASPAVVTEGPAKLMLMLDDAIQNETDKVQGLKAMVDIYWEKHSAQTAVLYAVILIFVLLSIITYIIIKAYWTNRRNLEEISAQKSQLEQQQKTLKNLYDQLSKATQSKLSFFTNVSHDLRTPLTLIAEPVSQMVNARYLTPEHKTLMRLADKNVKVLMRLINQILDFRKMENGKMTLNLTETDMRKAVQDWSDSFSRTLQKKDLKFALELDPENDYHIAVDTEKIERVFFNLISNAIKYTPQRGSIKVIMKVENNHLILEVKDNGQGISAENQKQIFDDFFRVDQVAPNGSGIGLALSKSFVELHGGSLKVDSQEGKGTVFTVELPLVHVDNQVGLQHLLTDQDPQQTASDSDSEYVNKETKSESLQTEEDSIDKSEIISEELSEVEIPENLDFSEEDASRPTILVVDDNSDIRTLVYGLLCDKYNVIQATNGTQGIRLASRFIPDVVVCDVIMPGMDGLETCKRLKDEVATSHIPVMLLTACAMDEQRVAGYECGADAYLSKPFNSKVLLARIEALILNRRRIHPQNQPVQVLPPVAKDSSTQPSREVKSASSGVLLPEADIDDQFYNKFLQVVEKNMSNCDLSVEDMASEVGLSRVQFYRKIKALTNYSPAELVKTLRLKRANQLLKTTQLTISEICYQVGFSSPSYFTKCYRDMFKENPSDTQQRTSKLKQ